jgi:hypothetical protein
MAIRDLFFGCRCLEMELNRGQREQGGKDDGLTILPDPRERSTTGMKW